MTTPTNNPTPPPSLPSREAVEGRFKCRHCGNRIYLDDNRGQPAWRHHASNFVECFGDLPTWAEPDPNEFCRAYLHLQEREAKWRRLWELDRKGCYITRQEAIELLDLRDELLPQRASEERRTGE